MFNSYLDRSSEITFFPRLFVICIITVDFFLWQQLTGCKIEEILQLKNVKGPEMLLERVIIRSLESCKSSSVLYVLRS